MVIVLKISRHFYDILLHNGSYYHRLRIRVLRQYLRG